MPAHSHEEGTWRTLRDVVSGLPDPLRPAHGDARDPVYGFDRELGSKAGAIDDDDNLYFVTGSFLRSVDSATGKIRWQKNIVPDGMLSSGPWTATPTIAWARW